VTKLDVEGGEPQPVIVTMKRKAARVDRTTDKVALIEHVLGRRVAGVRLHYFDSGT